MSEILQCRAGRVEIACAELPECVHETKTRHNDKQRQKLVFGVWCAIVQGLNLMPMPERGHLHQAILPLSMQTQKRTISSAFLTFEEEEKELFRCLPERMWGFSRK